VTDDAASARETGSEDLAAFVSAIGGDRSLRVEENLGEGFVRLRVGEAERRQAKHDVRCVEDAVIEMLRNARDAGARHVYVASSREGDLRTVVMLDDGDGIPQHLHKRVFDPRVTSKLDSVRMDRWGVHGRGMALYSISENSQVAEVMDSERGKGCALRVVIDTTKLPERADQSTWPQMGTDDEGTRAIVRGPHNIIRTCCEFALEEHGGCEVYVGSPTEVIATARRRVRPSVEGTDLLFVDDLSVLPVLERLYVAADASELMEQAERLGLTVSERTVHRILAGEVRPLRGVYGALTHTRRTRTGSKEVDLTKDRRGLKLTDDDLERFSAMLERDFAFIGERYYLTLAGAPKVRASSSRITVTFDLADSD